MPYEVYNFIGFRRCIKYFYYFSHSSNARTLEGQVDLTTQHEQAPVAEGARPAVTPSLSTLVAEIKQSVPLEGKLHPALDRLIAYDRANQSDLFHTLEVYLENNCNAQKCGRLLFLHRNSLVYRVRRIQEVGNCNLSDPEECSFLRLSLLLFEK